MQQLEIDENKKALIKPRPKNAYYALTLILAALWTFVFINENKPQQKIPVADKSTAALVNSHIRSGSTDIFSADLVEVGERR